MGVSSRSKDLTPAKAQSTPSFGGKRSIILKKMFIIFFTAFASLREIFRVSVVAIIINLDKVPTA
jgi:hypothetical protein